MCVCVHPVCCHLIRDGRGFHMFSNEVAVRHSLPSQALHVVGVVHVGLKM